MQWSEFEAACLDVLDYSGNIGGAWRRLDKDLRGWVCLEDMDQDSAAILESFKTWAESSFGSVQRAFQAMDADRGGGLTFEELKRACRRLGWNGQPRVLFDCIVSSERAPGGRARQLMWKDLAFLNMWVAKNAADIEAHSKVIESLWQELFETSRDRKCSASSRGSRRPTATSAAA